MTFHNKLMLQFQSEVVDQDFEKISKQTLMNMILHIADVSNPSRYLEIATTWAFKFAEEQFRIGDTRKRLGLPLNQYMDRFTPKISLNQFNFIGFIILPLFKSVGSYINLKEQINNLEGNRKFWEAYPSIVQTTIDHAPDNIDKILRDYIKENQ